MARKVDLETVPQINGQSLLEIDLGEVADKPWRLPGECVCVCGRVCGGWARCPNLPDYVGFPQRRYDTHLVISLLIAFQSF